MKYSIHDFPPKADLESKAVLKLCSSAHRYLAELKGASKSIPNQGILISTLALQEAKDSSAIENIITTHDELFQEDLLANAASNPAAKEVHDYAQALRRGFTLVKERGFLSLSHILAIQEELEKNRAGFRKLPGTDLRNSTGQIIYTPPQHPDEIQTLMTQFEHFINAPSPDMDPLVKIALLHHQFESIHPFYDGNGRTGRILNVLFLVVTGLLDIPVLYLSRYLIQTKQEYYRLLQQVRDTGAWEPWLMYMLTAVEKTAKSTLTKVESLRNILMAYKQGIRRDLPKIYSQDLLNNLFNHPYTKIEFLMKDLGFGRITATKYLDSLVETGYLTKKKLGRTNFYINNALMSLFLSQEEDIL